MLRSLLHSGHDDLIAQANRIAVRLERAEGKQVVLSCRQAQPFVAGLCGAWHAGATVELLPNVQPGTLDRVDADADVAYVLHDDPARRGRATKAIYVPELLAGEAVTVHAAMWPELAVRMTTSGTTERPKYVTKTMAQLVGELEVLVRVIPTARTVMSTVPLSHLYGLLWGALLPLRTGARIVSHEALLPADVAAVIEREGVDLLISTPAHLRAMAESPMPRGLRVISSGARMPAEIQLGLAMKHGWHVTDVLGSTETGGIATRVHPMNPWTPLPGGTVSAPNGQLVVESPWCAGARAELDDRIEMRPNGNFQYLGRNTELVKIAGKRAHAHAIEATILAVPDVTDVALVVHASANKEPRVAVAIVTERDVPRETIAAAIRAQFDAVFVPKILKVVAKIPRTDRGKIDSEAVRELLGIPSGRPTNLVEARRVAPGQYIADVPKDLVFFRGHFESFAILPGAVLVERVVWPIVKREVPEINGLRAIKRLRFRRPVFPDQQLAVTVKRAAGKLSFEVACNAEVVASGQLVVD